MATYRNHAYLLGARIDGSTGQPLGVYLTSGDFSHDAFGSGTWTTGISYYQVQVRRDALPWRTVASATTATGAVYTHAPGAHRYTFRVRVRDKVDNWGAWVSRQVTTP